MIHNSRPGCTIARSRAITRTRALAHLHIQRTHRSAIDFPCGAFDGSAHMSRAHPHHVRGGRALRFRPRNHRSWRDPEKEGKERTCETRSCRSRESRGARPRRRSVSKKTRRDPGRSCTHGRNPKRVTLARARRLRAKVAAAAARRAGRTSGGLTFGRPRSA